jgi:RNA polymerase sigma-70 factor, ECF subfamily
VENVDQTDKVQESELIERARSGDAGSFSALVEVHQERVIRAAYGLVGNLEDARDLAQEAFVKAYENLDRFESRSRFYTWLYRILANTCKDFLRKRKLRRTFSFWLGKEEDGELDPLSRAADRSKNASEQLENRELGYAVQNAMNTLPFRQRIVFTLRYMEGLSLEDIADSLNITIGAVKAHLWQAGQKMQELLKEERHGR